MTAKKNMLPEADETLDTIRGVSLFQSKKGYRFSVDAVLLENFIAGTRLNRGLELGAGSGVVSILLARRMRKAHIIAVELQRALAERAVRNVQLNGLSRRIEVIAESITRLKSLYATNTFDFVFSNPPFRRPKTGRMSLNNERAIARHEIELTLADLVSTASYLLKHSGRLFMIYHPFRLAELTELLRTSRLEPKRMRFVHSMAGEEAKMVLIEAAKGSGTWLTIDPPLYLYKKGKTYTDEVRIMFGLEKISNEV